MEILTVKEKVAEKRAEMKISGHKRRTKPYKELVDDFTKRGCVLLSKEEEYINADSILKFICSCGQVGEKTYKSFRKTPRCCLPGCKSQKQIEREKQKYNEAVKCFKDNGCKLLSKTCANQRQEVDFLCVCGNVYRKKWGKFKQTPHCNKCKGISIQDLIKFYADNNCVLLDEIKSTVREYKYNFKCKCGNLDIKSLYGFRDSPQCSKCDDLKYVKEIEMKYLNRNCVLLDSEKVLNGSKFITDPTPLSYVCSCGELDEKKLGVFLNNDKCSKCIGLSDKKLVKVRENRLKKLRLL